MAHPLFELPAEAVTWAVVADFLSLRLRESFSVEYKARPVPRVLETATAMGNTYGGLVLVGVEANGDLPGAVVGVAPADRERLVNMFVTQVDPPWSPEVLSVPVAAAADGDRVVLVVRVQADGAPRPLVLSGAMHVRSEGRNVPAGRAAIAALFAEPAAVAAAPLALAARGPLSHASPFHARGDDPGARPGPAGGHVAAAAARP